MVWNIFIALSFGSFLLFIGMVVLIGNRKRPFWKRRDRYRADCLDFDLAVYRPGIRDRFHRGTLIEASDMIISAVFLMIGFLVLREK
ncbi:hypothetical protein M769_0117495 [Bacillus haynesii]|nr:hypothetical protein M769_0117495 [Bacillus haynesii]